MIIALALASTLVTGGDASAPFLLPAPLLSCLTPEKSLTPQYDLNPGYLRGDFDGDGIPDYAARVLTEDGHLRLLLCWGSKKSEALLPKAVTDAPIEMDFAFDGWAVLDRQVIDRDLLALDEAEQPRPRPDGEGIIVVWAEEAGGMIYWSKGDMYWYNGGD